MSPHTTTLAELSRGQARIETKLDAALADHEGRIRSVEKWMWTAAGAGGFGALAGAGAAILQAVTV